MVDSAEYYGTLHRLYQICPDLIYKNVALLKYTN